MKEVGYGWILYLGAVVLLGGKVVFAEEKREPDLATALQLAVEKRDGLTGLSLRVTRGDALLFEGAEGDYVEGRFKFEPESVVRIASMTKPITATAVAMLVGQGKVEFDDPIDKYLPEFAGLKLASGKRAKRAPTIAECLSHTAGFRGVTMLKLPRDSAAFTGDNAAVVAELLESGLASEPGTKFAYTKFGYDVAALVIEKVTEKRFDVAMRELVFEPLGMHRTAFRLSDFLSDVKTRKLNGGPEYLNPAGGLLSTASDLALFFRFHVDGGKVGDRQILDAEILKKMYLRQPGAGDYRLGFRMTRGRIQHGGATGTTGWADLDSGLIFIGLSQNGSKIARPVWDRLGEMVVSRFGSEE